MFRKKRYWFLCAFKSVFAFLSFFSDIIRIFDTSVERKKIDDER